MYWKRIATVFNLFEKNTLLKPLLLIIFSIICFTTKADYQTRLDSLNHLYENTDDYNIQKDLLRQIANVYEYEGEWGLYDDVIAQMLEMAEQRNDSKQIAEVYNKRGIALSIRGKYKEALEQFHKSLEMYIPMNDSSSIGNLYENASVAYKDIGEAEKSIEYQMKSIEIRKKLKHPRLLNNYLHLAQVKKFLKDVEGQDYYLGLAKKMAETMDNISNSNKAIFYNELGSISNGRKQFDSALVYYQKVYDYSKLEDWYRGMAVGLGNLAGTYFDLKMYDSAIVCHRKSLALSLKIEDCMSITEEYNYLGELYLQINLLDSVLVNTDKAMKYAESCNLMVDKKNALYTYSQYYLAVKDYKKAYEYNELFHQLNDSLYSVEKQNNIAEMEAKFKTELKEQQIQILTKENENKNQRMWLSIALSSVLVLVVVIGILDFVRRKKRNEQKHEMLKQQLLRSQMNPHFLFNALGSIQNYMYKNDTRSAAQYLNNFARLTRAILEHSDQELVTLSEEIDTIRNYLELEQMQSKDAFSYRLEYGEDMEMDFIHIPPMIVQPFVENAIKHGIRSVNYQGELVVGFFEKEQDLVIEISDNGVGINQALKESKSGHVSKSMNIFEERRKLLAKKHNKEIDFEIMDRSSISKDQQGTLVKIVLPVDNLVPVE